MTPISDIHTFLPYTINQKEASLIIAKDQKEKNKFLEILVTDGFVQSHNAEELGDSIRDRKKTVILLNKENSKDVYDITIQYPTGQVSIFNPKNSNTVWISPEYMSGRVMILTTLEELKNFEQKGLSFREIAGLTYQE